MANYSEKLKDNQNSLKYFARIFLVHKKPILITSIATFVFSIIIALIFLDPIFHSAGIVKTSSQSSGGIGNLMGLVGGGGLELGDIGELSGGSATKELALYSQILSSRRAVEEAILKFNIIEEEDFKYMFDAVKYFRNDVMTIKSDKIAGTMEIGIFDKDPEKAKEMAEFMIAQLNKIYAEMNVLNAKNNKEFMELRFKEVSENLRQAEDSLIYYQNNFGISPDITIQASVKAELELEAELKSEEIKLELLRKIISPGEPEIKTQEEKIAAINKQLIKLRDTPINVNSVLGLKGSPDVVMNFLRLKREVEIQNKILTTIIPILEQSKIEEKRETPTVIVLDPPNVPDRKAKPKRSLIVLGITFFATFITFGYFVVRIKWREFSEDLYW